MKKILPILALLLFCLGCAPPKKMSDNSSNSPSPPQEQKVDQNQQIAPGTCYLSLKDCEIISDQKMIKGKVSQLHGYGAGFTEVIQLNQEIVIKIDKQDVQKLNKRSEFSCVISQVEKMGNKTYLKLIEVK
ncbi:hypothetical protein [Marinifilum caeruleilacunae]|uniref:Lipoprotein n=1 Tax=Marinifilum caeruleilacunae TaxID=2499076 RepID=A0ABX1X0U0_9BACT|nr:hypothetical protein [Marinifilum caeruleilacunae]NOU61718.1 hypothetical protein [Marinifilum caeruleilacunae]